MSHPSLLFLEGHLETNPDIMFLTTVSPNSPVLKSQHMRHSALASRSFATWPSQIETQVMSPRSSTRSLLWTMTRRPSTIRATITSLTSRKSHVRTLDCCLNPLLRTFLMIILLFKKKKTKKACIGNRLLDRERKKREGSVISVAESMSKKSWRNNIRCHSLQTQKILFWWMRSPRKSSTKSSTSCSWWKFRSEKIADWAQHGDPEFEAKKFRTRIIRVTKRAWISKKTMIESQSIGRPSSTRENTFV